MMMPSPIVSTSIVMKMKASAYRLAGAATGSLMFSPDAMGDIVFGARTGVSKYFPSWLLRTCYHRSMSPSPACSIRLAEKRDAAALPEIEKSAGALFRTLPELAWISDEPIGTADEFLPMIEAGTVWVAEIDSAGIVGELRGRIEDDALHIVELAVAGTFQQRGIGRALIDAAQVWARARGLHALTLTTFRHVAWNAPFYARYGFFELADAELDQRLATILREEAAHGLPDRCAMRLAIK
jgi:GNAT superfamily N-acetyltransferase